MYSNIQIKKNPETTTVYYFQNIVIGIVLSICFSDSDSDIDQTVDIDVAEAAELVTSFQKENRPTIGMKRPRSNRMPSKAQKCPRKQIGDCPQCPLLQAEIKELQEANAMLTEELNGCREAMQEQDANNSAQAPRPGKVSKAVAEKHQVRIQ